MAKKQTQTITINDKDYDFDKLTDEQKVLVNHVADLDRKISSTEFNLIQLRVGRDAFFKMLTDNLSQE